MTNENRSENILKVRPVTNMLLLPGVEYELQLDESSGDYLSSMASDVGMYLIALPLQKNFEQKSLTEDDFYRTGTLIYAKQIHRSENSEYLSVKAIERVRISQLLIHDEQVFAEYVILTDKMDLNEDNKKELVQFIKKSVHEMGKFIKGAEGFLKVVDGIDDINQLIGNLSQHMPISQKDKQALLETDSLKKRGFAFVDHLLREKEAIKFQVEMAERFSEKQNKAYRESVMREQLKTIQGELNKDGSNGYMEKIEAAGMPEEVKKVALEELEKLEIQNTSSPEYNVIRTYLDTLVAMPWKTEVAGEINLEAARKILDEQHYGLEKVKERIIQHLAVMKLRNDKRGSILLLVGPPGTGKTSLGKSVADALGRKYIRMSLGGIKDEAEIRGHRRTYIGAMPGRILQSIKKAGVNNPVFVLDEVDKLMASYNGDPASALLEVLDPEQNNSFTDHYLDVPYDLSGVFFVATANSLDGIQTPLVDRMELIQISSYTGNEKFHIAKDYLIKSVLEEHGLTAGQLCIEDDTLRNIIDDYTMEAGVRGLRRQLATIARVATEKVVTNSVELPYVIRTDMLEEILGRQVSRHEVAEHQNPAGVVTGLAWTPVGGEILFIEGTHIPGSGKLILTGKLGDVMQESAKIALSLVKSRLPLDTLHFNYKEKDIHIHVPSGAVPKDGPSAGIALTTAVASLITGIKVDSRLAMTGEITLRGAVTPIGGLKEKLIAAQRAGIKRVLIPEENMGDLKEIPGEVKDQLSIRPVSTIEEVFKEALGIDLPAPEEILMKQQELLLSHTGNI